MRLIDADALKELIPTTSVDFFENCRNCSLLYKEQVMELIDMTPTIDQWIPCSERLPKENECVGNVWKYYLIQDEYEDMHVAHLSSRGWETIESFNALECDVVAWMPLPEPWKGETE